VTTLIKNLRNKEKKGKEKRDDTFGTFSHVVSSRRSGGCGRPRLIVSPQAKRCLFGVHEFRRATAA